KPDAKISNNASVLFKIHIGCFINNSFLSIYFHTLAFMRSICQARLFVFHIAEKHDSTNDLIGSAILWRRNFM
ncbi:MAG: hypothetical protein P4L31_05260, partial [Candidatus Babeliales bacterium]|nr:hypothetical protein [Candidatus Babeliales bacterium]